MTFRRMLFGALLALLVLLTGAWATLALRFSNLPWEWLRLGVASLFATGFAAAFQFLRPRRRTLLVFAAAWTAVLAWYLLIPARSDRDWLPELARVTRASFDGDRVVVHDVRDFDWRTESDFRERWVDRTFDLRELRGVDFVMSQWGPTQVAHTMLSFGFANGEHLVFSIETRRERGQPQTAIRGLFKQYELIVVVGTEADVLRLRTNVRKEDLRVYPTTLTPEEARRGFVETLKSVDELANHPAYYNTISDNCTTAWLPLLHRIGRGRGFDLRLLLNGEADALAWERGTIRNDVPLAELRLRHHVNQYVQEESDPAGYSRRIRPWEKSADGR